MAATMIQPGAMLTPGYFDRNAQKDLLAAIEAVLRAAPLYTPRMPKSGKPMSVRMSNCGPLGWVTDAAGYRHPPQCCLINYYAGAARMGLHQDRDERDFAAPVVSLSLGDTCLFRVGGMRRNDPTRSLHLASGDALVLGAEARLAFHGVDRIMPGTSTLVSQGGRINLTLRRVTPDRA